MNNKNIDKYIVSEEELIQLGEKIKFSKSGEGIHYQVDKFLSTKTPIPIDKNSITIAEGEVDVEYSDHIAGAYEHIKIGDKEFTDTFILENTIDNYNGKKVKLKLEVSDE